MRPYYPQNAGRRSSQAWGLAPAPVSGYLSLMDPLPEDIVASPCVSVCTVDPVTKICIGCLRTLKEIGAWRSMSMAEKRAVVAACDERAQEQVRRGKDWKPLPKT